MSKVNTISTSSCVGLAILIKCIRYRPMYSQCTVIENYLCRHKMRSYGLTVAMIVTPLKYKLIALFKYNRFLPIDNSPIVGNSFFKSRQTFFFFFFLVNELSSSNTTQNSREKSLRPKSNFFYSKKPKL